VVDVFKELSIILDTHLSLDEAIDILLKGNLDKQIKNILFTMRYALQNGQPIAKALEQHKRLIGVLPILFFDLGFKNGNLQESIKALSIILIENQKAKKQFVSALSYPIVLLVTLFIATILIFKFVIPKFEHIFVQFGSNLPLATKYLLATKSFFDNYYILIAVSIISIFFSFKYLYDKYTKQIDQFIILQIPIISPLYQSFIFYRFFLALDMLIKANYQFQIALKSVKFIVKNQFVISKIEQISNDIQNGITISNAFSNTKLFNNITLRLLYTAQQTNTMEIVLTNITDIYKQKLTKNIKYFSSAIGPIFIMIISLLILWLVFALMLPIWDLGKVLH
jgi:general secretion pathway protein F